MLKTKSRTLHNDRYGEGNAQRSLGLGIKEDFFEEVTLEVSPKGGREASYIQHWGKEFMRQRELHVQGPKK